MGAAGLETGALLMVGAGVVAPSLPAPKTSMQRKLSSTSMKQVWLEGQAGTHSTR